MQRTAPALLLLSALPLAVASQACKSEETKKDEPKAATPGKEEKATKAKPDQAAKIKKLTEEFKPWRGDFASKTNPITDAKVELGRMLYFDARLSKNHDLSCNSCHLLDKYGVDGEPTSDGHKKQTGTRNSPTVYYAAGHLAQFWDGREPDVEAQAKGPILNPIEMAMPDEASVLEVLESIPGYVEAFEKAFPEEDPALTYDNLAKAIGAFERKLVTPSRWDDFLEGKHDLFSDQELAGLEKFVDVGCQTCHAGAHMGGDKYEKMGSVVEYPGLEDKGRFDATGKADDTHFFKVPSLRNIDKTGPYFHDGSIASLEEAIKLMAKHQLGAELSDKDVKNIASFLATMTGPLDESYIAEPKLPESGPNTPKPDPS